MVTMLSWDMDSIRAEPPEIIFKLTTCGFIPSICRSQSPARLERVVKAAGALGAAHHTGRATAKARIAMSRDRVFICVPPSAQKAPDKNMGLLSYYPFGGIPLTASLRRSHALHTL